MAKYVVPAKCKPIVKCENCGTLYVPDGMRWHGSACFEACPECGWEMNMRSDCIPLWKYNLIRWYREVLRK